MPHRIACILPKGEGFSPQSFGAVSLCVRDFALHSRYQAETIVTGTLPGPGFEGIRYAALPHVRWFENRTRGYARQCAEVIRREQAQLTELHNRPAWLRLLAPKVNSRFAIHYHNDPQEIEASRTPGERQKLLGRVSGIYCVSDYIRGRFLEGLDERARAKVHVIYNGLEIPAVLRPKENRIVFAGRMTEGKGALLLAQALKLALPRLPDWRAVIVGSGRHAVSDKRIPYERQIDETLTTVATQIEVPGFLSHEQTLDHFARAAIAVVPSLWQEPFGRTALEAMAYGCAIISSGRGALREVTQDAALTLADLAPETLAGAIFALAQNQTERERLQRLGRERAKFFSINKCARALDDARDSILAGRDAHAA